VNAVNFRRTKTPTLETLMKKTLLLITVLGCSALWAGAQTSTNADPQSGAAPAASASGQSSAGQTVPSTSAANSVTVDGCLAGSGSSYTLKDKSSGVTYQLAGDLAKLAPHVGHELQLTGTPSNGSAGATAAGATSSTPTASASASSSPTLNLMSGKVISNTCSAQ
jgi:hypothetical protein